MKIDENWNLILPVDDSVQVFHTPISQNVFEVNHKLLRFTKDELFANGPQSAILSGMYVAALTLRDIGAKLAADRGDPDGDSGAKAFLAELSRLSMILAPGDAGYEITPVAAAISSGAISADAWADIENELVFFTAAVFVNARGNRKTAAMTVAEVMNCSLTSSTCEEHAAGLRTSPKPATPKAAEPAQSSVPI